MDAKALAKSKRAHSRKHNLNPKSKQHSSQSGDAGNPITATQKFPQRHSGLLSNWDRYEDEEQPELGEGVSAVGAGTSTSRSSSSGKVDASDVLVPKSKGADYRYLVEEARSQRQFRNRGDFSLDAVSSLDETLPEFFQEASSSLISIKGEAILSWCNDDKFSIEDESRPIPEVPFLSLNLDKLEEQLAKLDLASRLFIDPDLLPPEWVGIPYDLLAVENQYFVEFAVSPTSDVVSDKIQMQETEATRRKVDKFSLKEGMDDDEIAKRNSGSQSLPTSSLNHIVSGTSPTYRSSEAVSSICTPQPTEVPSVDKRGYSALFEAGAAEAELDALLDSFGESKYAYPASSYSSVSYLPFGQQNYLPLPQTSSQGWSSSGAMINHNIDTFLDDLLEETLMSPSTPKQVKATPSPPLPDKTTQSDSTVLNDFDNWLDTI